MAARYLPGVDGLRAVAVVAVVLFHLNERLLPGGFVGVDVFFVISGFVVTLSAMSQRSRTLPNFLGWFYARRAIRILPALIVCLLVTSLMSMLFIPNGFYGTMNNKTAAAAFLGISNIILTVFSDGYFDPTTEYNPFAHTWSLAVEEQFYILAPLLIFAACRHRSGSPGRRRVVWIVAALAIVSLAAAAALTVLWPRFAFFMLPARFWELAAGVLLALTREHWEPRLAAAPTAFRLALVGGSGLLLSLSVVHADAGLFPFPWALAPVVATAGLIAAVVSARSGDLAEAFAAGPLVFLGKLSYSLYLWHWPVIVLFRWTVGIETLGQMAAAVVLIGLATIFSYRYVEQPFRTGPLLATMRKSQVILVAALLAVTGAATTRLLQVSARWASLSVTTDVSVWFPFEVEIRSDQASNCGVRRSSASFGQGGLVSLSPVDCRETRASHLFVAGDSHSGAYELMVAEYASRRGVHANIYSMPGCAVVNLRKPLAEATASCREFQDRVQAAILANVRPGDVLFLPSLRVDRFAEGLANQTPATEAVDKPAKEEQAFQEAVAFLDDLSERGVNIVFEAPKPVFRNSPFKCSDWFNRSNPQCSDGFVSARREIEERRQPVVDAMIRISHRLPRVYVWDPLPVLCPGDVCRAYAGDKPLFFDHDHLSGYGNRYLLASFETFVDRVAR